jgi:hypothetical protein
LEVYFYGSGQFGAPNPGEDGLAVVLGVIIPENHKEALHRDFLSFVENLPKDCFRNGEPKGHLLSAEHYWMLATILNAHPGIMFVPVTVNNSSLLRSEIESWPAELRQILDRKGGECLYDKMRSEVQELAKRCGNLSIDQLNRLFTYTVAVREAIKGIALFYHCKTYYQLYSPIRLFLDRTVKANSREELVFKEMVFIWVTSNWMVTTIQQIHTEAHPFIQTYGTNLDGEPALDVSKMIRGNIEFAVSRTRWQIQLADMLAAAWINILRDDRNTRGYLPVFRILQRYSTRPKDQPLGIIGFVKRSSSALAAAPARFEIFRRISTDEGKILPCDWDEN